MTKSIRINLLDIEWAMFIANPFGVDYESMKSKLKALFRTNGYVDGNECKLHQKNNILEYSFEVVE